MLLRVTKLTRLIFWIRLKNLSAFLNNYNAMGTGDPEIKIYENNSNAEHHLRSLS